MSLQLYRFREVAEILGLSEQHVKALVGAGDIPSIVIGKRSRRVDARDLQAYIDERRGDVDSKKEAAG